VGIEVEKIMEMTTKVFQSPGYQFLLQNAPEAYIRAVRIWLIKERGRFVGDRRHGPGSFTKKIMKKEISGVPGEHWSYNVARTFKGYINESPGNLSLQMGVNIKHPKPFGQSLSKMEEGYTEKSSGYMVTPVYENLPFSRPRKKALEEFDRMLRERLLEMIRGTNGRIYYCDKKTGKMLFILGRSIKVKSKFNFIGSWEKQLPSVRGRGQRMIDRQTEKLAQGKFL
jgi:hypothetical protein